MATLLALWMVTSAATALVLLPALLVVARPRFLGLDPALKAALGAVDGAGAWTTSHHP